MFQGRNLIGSGVVRLIAPLCCLVGGYNETISRATGDGMHQLLGC